MVSVIVPVYNGERTVAEALDSVFSQEFGDEVEVIVTNDGSTDSTQSVLDAFDKRITVIQQDNQGQSAARNVAIERSRGEYLALLDADDIWLPGRLSKTIAALESNPSAVLAFSDFIRIDQDGIPVHWTTVPAHLAHPPSMEEILTNWWPIAPTTVTMRRETWEACGGFPTEAKGGFEDLLFFISARERGEFEYVSESLAKFRMTYADRMPDKWSPDIFIRIMAKRYGSRAKKLLREVRNLYGGSFAVKALNAMGRGDRTEAIRCWLRVLHYDPFYLLRTEQLWRFPRRRNLGRLARVLRPKPNGE
jgi:glycosyltransferase involved in cell wall biosynthesis